MLDRSGNKLVHVVTVPLFMLRSLDVDVSYLVHAVSRPLTISKRRTVLKDRSTLMSMGFPTRMFSDGLARLLIHGHPEAQRRSVHLR